MCPVVVDIVTNENFPCFVDHGADIEDPDSAVDKSERKRRYARNGFRHLTYGIPLRECKLINWENFKTIFIEMDPEFFSATRIEFQNIFINIFNTLLHNKIDPECEKRVEIFIKNLLCAYPFLDPAENEQLFLPQKINYAWQLIEYHVNKIDISPQSGLLAQLIEDQDRLYAYGLVPKTKAAHPILLFEGTTYPSRTCFPLNVLENFRPNHSVGEGHNISQVILWLKKNGKAIVGGHSKGGTLSMILTAQYPELILEAHCFNPTACCDATITRLKNYSEYKGNKPEINIFTQEGDLIFLIEHKFLDGVNVYLIRNDIKFGLVEAHAHYLTGRPGTMITKLDNIEIEIITKEREFASDLKKALNVVMYPLLYLQLIYKLCMRKLQRFCDQHPTIAFCILFAVTFSVGIGLLFTGPGASLIAPLILHMGPPLAYGFLTIAALSISAAHGFIGPKLTKLAINIASSCTLAGIAIGTFMTIFSIAAVCSGIKIGVKSLCNAVNSCCQRYSIEQIQTPSPSLQPNQSLNQSTKISLQTLNHGAIVSGKMEEDNIEVMQKTTASEKTVPNVPTEKKSQLQTTINHQISQDLESNSPKPR